MHTPFRFLPLAAAPLLLLPLSFCEAQTPAAPALKTSRAVPEGGIPHGKGSTTGAGKFVPAAAAGSTTPSASAGTLKPEEAEKQLREALKVQDMIQMVS